MLFFFFGSFILVPLVEKFLFLFFMITPEIKYTYLTDLCARVLSHFNLVLLFATLWAVEG